MLTLIGTEHGDLMGSERLECLLEIVHPDILSVEFSPESLQMSENDAADVAQIVSEASKMGVRDTFVRFFYDLIAKHGLTGFEYTVSKSYVDRHKIPLILSDDPKLASACRNVKLDELRRAIIGLPTEVKIPIPTEEELVKDTDKNYEFAVSIIKGEIPFEQADRFIGNYRGVLIGRRDVYMEQIIRQTYTGQSNHQRSVLAHVCGFAHLLDDPKKETLYSRIRDLNPERRLLNRPEQAL